jgi:hypothetical protein
MNSDPLLIHGYSNSPNARIPAAGTIFPQYEVGDPESFNELIAAIDKDVWNLGGYHPSWNLEVSWPSIAPAI